MPVLYYCVKEMGDFLADKGQGFICGDAVDAPHKTLRNLDIKAADSNSYSLVVTNDPKSMRGHDYRAPLTGITLLVGKSFAHARDLD